MVEQLRANEKPDVVIAATHMGHYDNGKHGSNAPGDVEMARAAGGLPRHDRWRPLAGSGVHGTGKP